MIDSVGTTYAEVMDDRCVLCGECVANCPAKAFKKVGGRMRADRRLCIGCHCCSEVCEQRAITMRRPLTGHAAAPAARRLARRGIVDFVLHRRGAEDAEKESSSINICAESVLCVLCASAVNMPDSFGVVLDQREDLIFLQLLRAFEEREVYQEAAADDFAAGLLDQAGGGFGGAAGGDEVVNQQDALAARHRVGVHLDAIGPVLERILRAERLQPAASWWSRSASLQGRRLPRQGIITRDAPIDR